MAIQAILAGNTGNIAKAPNLEVIPGSLGLVPLTEPLGIAPLKPKPPRIEKRPSGIVDSLRSLQETAFVKRSACLVNECMSCPFARARGNC